MPHYTAVRPIAVMHCDQTSFREKLFVRGLVSTLMGNARFNGGGFGACLILGEDEAARALYDLSSCAGSGASSFDSGGLPASELVWWDLLQPRLAMQDRALSRLEALQRCRAAVVVMSAAYAASPGGTARQALTSPLLADLLPFASEFAAERDLIVSRFSDPHPQQPLCLVVLKYSAEGSSEPCPDFRLPSFPKGHPAAADGHRSQPGPVFAQV